MTLTLKTPSEILSDVPKPELATIDQLRLNGNDWLIVCGGFEDRCSAVLQKALEGNSLFNVLLIRYEPFISENKADAMRAICQDVGIRVLELTYDRQEPAYFGSVVLRALPRVGGCVYIDISGMSRLLIVQLLVELRRQPIRYDKSFVLYTEAKNYPPTEVEAATQLARSEADPSFPIFFLSSGVYEVTLLPELTSSAPAAVQTRLVAFPSLDAHQLTALRAELQPARLSLIEGIPPGPHNQWREHMVSAANRLEDIQNAEKCRASTLDYKETLDCLLNIYEKHGVLERLLISPTGSKMQSVAVGLLRSFLDDVQIVYPTPRDFLKPEKYTEGIGAMHMLPLEQFSARGAETTNK